LWSKIRNRSAEKGGRGDPQRLFTAFHLSLFSALDTQNNKTMKKLITIILLALHLNAFSQGDPSDGDGTVPVDGGISLLLAAGAVYGARRLKRVVGKEEK
jgi:hypothetical protein